jgi:hypothetical protein
MTGAGDVLRARLSRRGAALLRPYNGGPARCRRPFEAQGELRARRYVIAANLL